MNISRKILSDTVNKQVFKTAAAWNARGYLVGGYVRDILCGVKSKDRDFVFNKNVKNIALAAAKYSEGTFIVLKNRQTYRTVIKKRKETIDFSQLKKTINNDLKERDFTVNAIAWSPETGIIDPFNGKKDIDRHLIRCVLTKNLLKDPLRIIRAYRLAAEFNCRISNETRKHLRSYSGKIINVAHERITDEFFKILSNINCIKSLNECYKDGVLEKILKTRKINILAGRVKKLNSFDSHLKTQLQQLRKTNITLEHKKIYKLLNEEVSQGLNRLGLLHLYFLIDCDSFSKSLLRASKKIHKAIKDIHNGITETKIKKTNKELYKIFLFSGERIFEVALMMSFLKKKKINFYFRRAEEFLKKKNEIPLDGNDIQDILKVKPGRKLGIILTRLQEEWLKGTVRTRQQAVKWLISNFT